MGTEIDESKLIEDLRHGSHAAFDAIYELYAKRLLAYCLQYTKLTADAEDIVQGMFVKLWMRRQDIKQKNSVKALLFTMSHNAVIDAYRHRLFSPMYEEYIDYKVSSEGLTSEEIEYEEFVLRIENILKQMPETQQTAIRMSKFQGMHNAEIAKALNLSEQTVKNAVSTGMKILRKKLGLLTLFLVMLFFISN